MIQGTASDAGKSTLVAGLGRLLARRGVRVAPFKPQNMALNSAVTADGGEIGRAQAVQAMACGVKPTVHMNPILLKPHSDTGAQVIVQGKAITNMQAQAYHDYKTVAMNAVLESHQTLMQQYACVLVEGAGSPAEINLRKGDIANMGFAEAVDCDVLLVADIDKGGVFAQLVGTLALLSPSEQRRVKGFIINRFRGDISLLESGLTWLEDRTGIPVLGVIPYLQKFHLEAEDGIDQQQEVRDGALKVRVPVLPRISNHTDFDPLRLHPGVDLQFVGPGHRLGPCDLIVLPGSKSVRADLEHLTEQGWAGELTKHLRYGGKVLGICGGFQMLGQEIHDPEGIEGTPGSSKALGLLDCATTLTPEKALTNVSGELLPDGAACSGYEIHAGRTDGPALNRPFAKLTNNTELAHDAVTFDGAMSDDNQIRATYLHGIFESTPAMYNILNWAGLNTQQDVFDYDAFRDAEIERLADTLEQHLNLDKVLALAGVQASV